MLERAVRGAALIFDSFRQPLPAGMRAGRLSLSSRQLLYKAGRYTIRVQVEPAAAWHRCCIVGQILDAEDPTAVLRDIAVLAMKGTKTLDRTLTNQLGEFELEPSAVGNLQLSVSVPEIGTFSVPSPHWTMKGRAKGRDSRRQEGRAGR